MAKRGRKKDIDNKSLAELKELAKSYATEAIERIRHLMNNAQSEQVQLSAAALMLERGIGKTGINNEDLDSAFIGVLNVKFIKAANNDISREVPTIIHAKQIQGS